MKAQGQTGSTFGQLETVWDGRSTCVSPNRARTSSASVIDQSRHNDRLR